MRSRVLLAVILALDAGVVAAQTNLTSSVTSKVPVYISHNGDDNVGANFFTVLKQELGKSARYELGTSDAHDQRLRFYIHLLTIDVPSNGTGPGREGPSVVSVVIEEMGLPGSHPVFMWYHKAFLVRPNNLAEMARLLIGDMDAHWCNTMKDEAADCPAELLAPVYRLFPPAKR